MEQSNRFSSLIFPPRLFGYILYRSAVHRFYDIFIFKLMMSNTTILYSLILLNLFKHRAFNFVINFILSRYLPSLFFCLMSKITYVCTDFSRQTLYCISIVFQYRSNRVYLKIWLYYYSTHREKYFASLRKALTSYCRSNITLLFYIIIKYSYLLLY